MFLHQRINEKVFVVLSLLFFSGALIPHIPEGHPIVRILPILAFGILATTCFLIAARWKRVVRIAFRERFLWVLVGITLASALFSDMPLLTLYRNEGIHGLGLGVLPLIQVTLFGVYFATRYSLQ